MSLTSFIMVLLLSSTAISESITGHSAFDDIINEHANPLPGYSTQSIHYDKSHNVIHIKLANENIDISSMSPDEASSLNMKQKEALMPICQQHIAILANKPVTIRYYFKDKNGILISIYDINQWTCKYF